MFYNKLELKNTLSDISWLNPLSFIYIYGKKLKHKVYWSDIVFETQICLVSLNVLKNYYLEKILTFRQKSSHSSMPDKLDKVHLYIEIFLSK